MSKRDARLLLEDILSSAGKIISYTYGLSFDEYMEDEKTIDAVIRNFEIIGEAAGRLPDDIKDAFATVDWHRLRGFRNRIVHDYMGVDHGIVWNIKTEFLPQMIEEIKQILSKPER